MRLLKKVLETETITVKRCCKNCKYFAKTYIKEIKTKSSKVVHIKLPRKPPVLKKDGFCIKGVWGTTREKIAQVNAGDACNYYKER